MPKAKAKKNSNKASKGTLLIADNIEKDGSEPCVETEGTALEVTASIRRGLGNFDPGFGKIGGRTNIGNGKEAYLKEILKEDITMDVLNISVGSKPSTRQNGA